MSHNICIINISQKLQKYIKVKMWHVVLTIKKNNELLICIRLYAQQAGKNSVSLDKPVYINQDTPHHILSRCDDFWLHLQKSSLIQYKKYQFSKLQNVRSQQ
jgi:hypothetical protein